MRKYANASEALKALQHMTKNGQTYTPVQVYNSAQRSEAWAQKKGSAIEKAIWSKVKADAEALVAVSYAKAKKAGKFIPCDENCMGSVSPDCECSCGGTNHGIHAAIAG
jgi:hypothetical protein